jgi:membrane protein YqaA with SNARE-associated domain
MVIRFVLAAVVFLGVVVLIASAFRPQLEALGRGFVARFGLGGMALGTFLADGFHVPIPPQFYMLLAIGAGTPDLEAFAVIAAGSLVGGASGYTVARQLSRFPRLWNWLMRVGGGKLHQQLEGRNAYRSALIASVTPIAFSVQCHVSGLYRLPPRAFALILALRIPKLVFFFYVVKFGWTIF